MAKELKIIGVDDYEYIVDIDDLEMIIIKGKHGRFEFKPDEIKSIEIAKN